MNLPRQNTHQVLVGGIAMGGGAPVVVQSMLSTPTTDVAACLEMINRLNDAGCELVRIAIPHSKALDAFAEICQASPLPVIADIHFDHRLAIQAAKRGAAKLRINPGNIGAMDKVDAVIEAAGAAGIPIRIGVNAGSLAPNYAEKSELTLVQKMVASAVGFVEHFEQLGFTQLVLAAKAHDVPTTISTYQQLSKELPQIPLHVGVTEAGTSFQGTVKSAIGIGSLLALGIGDTIRVSLTADPVEEVKVAWEILAALGLRRRSPELISCPTCGRCEVDLIGIATEVSNRLEDIAKPISVAVMGCVVNGPGEASGADVGVACGRGNGVIFSKGEVLYTVSEDKIITALFEEIDNAID